MSDWHSAGITYDWESGEVRLYIDGKWIMKEPHAMAILGIPDRFGQPHQEFRHKGAIQFKPHNDDVNWDSIAMEHDKQ